MRNAAGRVQQLPLWVQVGLLFVVYLFAAKASLTVAIPPGYATPVWPPSGIALAALLVLGTRVWPGVWAAATLINFAVNHSLSLAVMMGIGNTIEALAGATLVRQFIGVPYRFERAKDVAKFVVIAAASCTIAATIAVVSMKLADMLSWQDLLANWWTWWQGDVAGIVIVTPLILSWSVRYGGTWSGAKWMEAACLGLALLLVTHETFDDAIGILAPLPNSFVIFPFIIWAALRFSQRIVTTATSAVCALSIYYTVQGGGPFAPLSMNRSLLVLLAFVSTVVVTGLMISAVLTERRRALERLNQLLVQFQEQAITDPLTGLYNRRFLWEFLRREWIRAARKDARVAVIMLDLDHFKRINDALGHEAGDFVLTAVAGLLRTQIRSSDIVCRYGGEEFAIVMPEATPENVRLRAEEIREAIGRLKMDHHGASLGTVSASLGIALYPDHAGDPDSLVQAADAALYEAKGAGRDRTVFSAPQQLSQIPASPTIHC